MIFFSECSWLRKDIISLFKDEGLYITIDTYLIKTDFLDISFNLNIGKYFIYTFKIQPSTVNYQAIPINDQQTHSNLIL